MKSISLPGISTRKKVQLKYVVKIKKNFQKLKSISLLGISTRKKVQLKEVVQLNRTCKH